MDGGEKVLLKFSQNKCEIQITRPAISPRKTDQGKYGPLKAVSRHYLHTQRRSIKCARSGDVWLIHTSKVPLQCLAMCWILLWRMKRTEQVELIVLGKSAPWPIQWSTSLLRRTFVQLLYIMCKAPPLYVMYKAPLLYFMHKAPPLYIMYTKPPWRNDAGTNGLLPGSGAILIDFHSYLQWFSRSRQSLQQMIIMKHT